MFLLLLVFDVRPVALAGRLPLVVRVRCVASCHIQLCVPACTSVLRAASSPVSVKLAVAFSCAERSVDWPHATLLLRYVVLCCVASRRRRAPAPRNMKAVAAAMTACTCTLAWQTYSHSFVRHDLSFSFTFWISSSSPPLLQFSPAVPVCFYRRLTRYFTARLDSTRLEAGADDFEKGGRAADSVQTFGGSSSLFILIACLP
ncbi:unnamed protein product [Soboliphyme baturini]|uniref:Secreted protein n=1 Tax=Soboliphyme baturini TaxID=241478 RepID=A0A183ICC6_9BILA|nr:unnamed protein product [Soboliphyme baturini]